MTEIDCRTCGNLSATCDGCTLYGNDPKKAAAACARDGFKNYRPTDTAEFKPGQDVWCIEKNRAGIPQCIFPCTLLVHVQDTVIVSYLNCIPLPDLLAAEVRHSKGIRTNSLAAYPAYDCYPTQTLASEAMKKELED